jgi:hypothetical protein
MTKQEYDSLGADNKLIVQVLLEMLRELKWINRQVEQIEQDETVKVHAS